MTPVRRIIILLLIVAGVSGSSGQEIPPVDDDSADVSVYEQLQGADAAGDLEPPEEEWMGAASGHAPRRPADGWDLWLRSRWSGRLQMAKGYQTGEYAGNNLKIYNRIRLRREGSFTAGVVTEKDPGESGPLDFVSFTFSTENLFSPFRITLGDFRAVAGQGLVFGSTRRFGKGSSAGAAVLRSPGRISPSFSSDEMQFFRGAGVEVFLGPVTLAVMGSRRSLSFTGGTDGELRVPDNTGYHRTAGELEQRGNVKEALKGGMLRFGHPGEAQFGVNLYASDFSAPVRASPVTQHTRRRFRCGSVDLTVPAGPVTLSAEWEWWSGSPSGIVGMHIAPHPAVALLFLHRRYSADANFLHGSGFGEAGGTGNETGTYAGLEGEILPGLNFTVYLDIFHSIVPARGVVFPERRLDRSLYLAYSGLGFVEISLRCQVKDAEERGLLAPPEVPSSQVNAPVRTEKYRIEGVINLGGKGKSRFRLDHVRYAAGGTPGRESGTALTVTIGTEPLRHLLVETGMTLFDTDSYDTRIYRVERDLPGSLTGVALSGEGARWYMLSSYEYSGVLKFSLKYSFLQRSDVRRIGSGPEEMPSNVAERAGMQLDVRF